MSSPSSRVAAAAAAGVALLPGSHALAHGCAGDRLFPATIETDDPFVADEATFATVDKNPTDPKECAESLAELLTRANHLLTESFRAQVKWQGISGTEWRVLAALLDNDAVTMTTLANLVLFKQPTLTKAVDRMERAQLVERRTPNEDRRRTTVHLTERGRRIAAPLLARARRHDAALNRVFGESQSRELRSALVELIERVRELPSLHSALA